MHVKRKRLIWVVAVIALVAAVAFFVWRNVVIPQAAFNGPGNIPYHVNGTVVAIEGKKKIVIAPDEPFYGNDSVTVYLDEPNAAYCADVGLAVGEAVIVGYFDSDDVSDDGDAIKATTVDIPSRWEEDFNCHAGSSS